MLEPQPLAGGEGSVLDPVVAIRYKVTLEPDQVVMLDVVTGMTETREAALHLIDKYQDRHLADRVFELAWTHSQVVLRQLNATESDAQLYSRLASSIIYPNAALRADASILIRNHRGQSGLWAYAISGDLPIVLMQIKDPANIDLARQMVQAHAYWRLKGLVVDLVIWYEDNSGYRQALHDQIMGLIASGIDAQAIDRPGGIFVRLLDQISSEDRVLMQSVARAILSDARGSLADQIKRAAPVVPKLPLGVFEARAEPYQLLAERRPRRRARADPRQRHRRLFSADGREYVIRTDGASRTPAPWVNVLANPSFGSVVSESGQAYTWSENAHEFRLTPWDNDPVSDGGGEAFYIRDEQTGRFWSPTALPVRAKGEYITRHGFGYSVFEHAEEAIHSELTTFVALDAPIKYSVIKLRNDSSVPRRLSVTGYVEWVLGDLRSKSSMHVVTELDPLSGALFARNAYNTEFTGRVGFFQVEAQNKTMTADRNEFIGRNRNLANPAAMNRARLSGKVGAGLDPCAAIQVMIELQPGQERELVFMLGVGGRRNADASGLVQRYNGSAAAAAAFDMVRDHWDATLGAVRIETPDPTLDVHRQRLADVPDHRLPHVGAQRLLPVGRRVRLPRPAAGRDGDDPHPAADPARAPAAVRGAPVRRRRRPALVASAVGPRRAHPLLGRLPVAAAGDPPLRDRHGRPQRADRAGAVPRGPHADARKRSPTTTCRATRTRTPTCTSTACAPSSAACASASTGCR